LYVSRKDSIGKWEPAQNLGPGINSDKLYYCPFIDEPRGVFYFSSNRAGKLQKPASLEMINDYNNGPSNGMGSIYQIKLDNSGISR
jgi:hypothetical protein